MFDQLFPPSLDHNYRGHLVGFWLFALILAMKTAIALGTIFNGRAAAQSADGVPLDTFGPAAANAVLTLFALWGLAQLVFSAFGVLALVRYRSMIPLLYALFLFEHLARRGILLLKPVAREGTPSGLYINLILLALLLLGLVLSLRTRGVAATLGG